MNKQKNFYQLQQVLKNIFEYGNEVNFSEEDISFLKESIKKNQENPTKDKESQLFSGVYLYLILLSNESFSPQLLELLPDESKLSKLDTTLSEIVLDLSFDNKFIAKVKQKNLNFEISLKEEKLLDALRNWEFSQYLPELFILTRRSQENKQNIIPELEEELSESSSESSFEEELTQEVFKVNTIPIPEEEEDDGSSSCSMEESEVISSFSLSKGNSDDITPRAKSEKAHPKETLMKNPHINKLVSNSVQGDLGNSEIKKDIPQNPKSKHFPTKISGFAKYKVEKNSQNKIISGLSTFTSQNKNEKKENEPSTMDIPQRTRSKSYKAKRKEAKKEEKNLNNVKKRLADLVEPNFNKKNQRIGGFTEYIVNSPCLEPVKRPKIKRRKSLNPSSQKKNHLFIPEKKTIKFRIKADKKKSYDPLSPHSSKRSSYFLPKKKTKKKSKNQIFPGLEESSPFSVSRTPVIPRRDIFGSPYSSSTNRIKLNGILGPKNKIRLPNRIGSKSMNISKKRSIQLQNETATIELPNSQDLLSPSMFFGSKEKKNNLIIRPINLKRRNIGSTFRTKTPKSTNGNNFFVKVKKNNDKY